MLPSLLVRLSVCAKVRASWNERNLACPPRKLIQYASRYVSLARTVRTETILIGVSRRVKFLTVPKSGFTAARIPNEVADSTFEVRKRTLCGADMISRRRCIREGVEDRAEAERYTVADVVVRRLQEHGDA